MSNVGPYRFGAIRAFRKVFGPGAGSPRSRLGGADFSRGKLLRPLSGADILSIESEAMIRQRYSPGLLLLGLLLR